MVRAENSKYVQLVAKKKTGTMYLTHFYNFFIVIVHVQWRARNFAHIGQLLS
jgi:hypothetical protein